MTTSIQVAHAGSLTTLLQRNLAPNFTAKLGYPVTRQAGPAVGLANQILHGELSPDVYMSADAETNRLLMGEAGGHKVAWFFGFARSRMVLAYSPNSRFRADFDAAAVGQANWYEILQSPGLVFKRSDPRVDPGGYRSVFVFQLAEQYYHLPGLKERILRGDDNEEQLMMGKPPNLFDGSVDAMLMYITSALDYGLPYIQLPDEIDLSNAAHWEHYQSTSYTNPQGQIFHGTPAIYSITIPLAASNPGGATAFVAYLLSKTGQAAVNQRGFIAIPALLGGELAAVPSVLQPLIAASYR